MTMSVTSWYQGRLHFLWKETMSLSPVEKAQLVHWIGALVLMMEFETRQSLQCPPFKKQNTGTSMNC